MFQPKILDRHLVLYCFIGCVGAGLDFIVFSTLTLYGKLHPQLANMIGVSLGIITNFFLNYYFNFRNTGNLLLRLVSFYLVGLLGLALSALLLHLLIGKMQFSPVAAKICTIFAVTMVQYTLNKAISFRKKFKND